MSVAVKMTHRFFFFAFSKLLLDVKIKLNFELLFSA